MSSQIAKANFGKNPSSISGERELKRANHVFVSKIYSVDRSLKTYRWIRHGGTVSETSSFLSFSKIQFSNVYVTMKIL